MVLAPLVVDRKGEQVELFDELRAQGFVRMRIDGTGARDRRAAEARARTRSTPIEVVVDRLQRARRRASSGSPNRSRPRCATPTAARSRSRWTRGTRAPLLGEVRLPGLQLLAARARAAALLVQQPDGRVPALRRPRHDQLLRSEARRRASRSSRSRRARSRAGTGATSSTSRCCSALAKHYGFDLERPFAKLPERVQHDRAARLAATRRSRSRYLSERGQPHDARARVRGHPARTSSAATARPTRSWCARSSRSTSTRSPAPSATARGCGARRATSRSARRDARAIYEVSALPLKQTPRLLRGARARRARSTRSPRRSSGRSCSRLAFLNNVGLDYLSLDRSADTLSGGEAQRIRLASQIGSGLTGVMYVLDEPSIGLHQRDNDAAARDAEAPARPRQHRDRGRARRGRDRAADHVVDMGPGAGEHGGQVVAQGTPEEIRRAPALAHRPVPRRAPADPDAARGATASTRSAS